MKNKLKLIIVIALVFVFSLVAWRMSILPLWGVLPLLFFLSAWMLIVLAFESQFKTVPEFWKRLLFTSTGAILLSLAFPPYSLTPFALFALLPLFHLMDEALLKKKSSWFLIFHFFVLWNILTTWWVANAALMPGIVAIWLNSMLMLIPVWCGLQTKKYLPGLGFWPFLFYWIAFEQIHHQWEISWPWLTIGNAWSGFVSWVQWYEFTGTFGGTAWTILINLLIHQFGGRPIYSGEHSIHTIWRTHKIKGSAILLAILAPVCFSWVILFRTAEPEKEVEIAVVQANFEPHYEKFEIGESVQFHRFDSLSRTVIRPSTQYLVFPETSFGEAGAVLRSNHLKGDPRIQYWKNFLDSFPDLALVTGITSIRELSDSETPGRASRKFIQTASEKYYEVENAAIQIKANSDSIPLYRKSRLVPGAEIFPYREWLPFLKPIVDKLGGSLEGLATQENREVFINGNHIIAPVICYESIYGDYMRGYLKNGAQAIFVMTNDGWWDDTPGYIQHREFSKLRAIELRRPVIRSANSGSSCFINVKGEISQATAYDIPIAIRETVGFTDRTSFFAKYGDLIGYGSRFISLAIMLTIIALAGYQKLMAKSKDFMKIN
ncbi:MAG: apolipoprotein N-acyltransferase [Saprospiraceae bacterium]|nr:apolipoprotein N-acyltransferase [Saprospiraceae bacterium]